MSKSPVSPFLSPSSSSGSYTPSALSPAPAVCAASAVAFSASSPKPADDEASHGDDHQQQMLYFFEGCLNKKGQINGFGWRPRWFRITDRQLIYFSVENKAKTGAAPRGCGDLQDIVAMEFISSPHKGSAPKFGEFRIRIDFSDFSWSMRTPSETAFMAWRQAMETKLPHLCPIEAGEEILHRGLVRLRMFKVKDQMEFNDMYAVVTKVRLIWYWNEAVSTAPEGAFAHLRLATIHDYQSFPVRMSSSSSSSNDRQEENVFRFKSKFSKWVMAAKSREDFDLWDRIFTENIPAPGSVEQIQARRVHEETEPKLSKSSILLAKAMWYPSLVGNLFMHKINPEQWRWWDRVDDYLLLGALPFTSDLEKLKECGVKAVVTLNEEWELKAKSVMTPDDWKAAGIDHLHLPTLDFFCAPSVPDMSRGVEFIKSHVDKEEVTLVHCKAGRGRSATLVLCYLITHRRMSPTQALEYVKRSREQVELGKEQWETVLRFAGPGWTS